MKILKLTSTIISLSSLIDDSNGLLIKHKSDYIPEDDLFGDDIEQV